MPRRRLARVVRETESSVYIQVGSNEYRVDRNDWETFVNWFRRHTHLSPLTAFAVSVGHTEGLTQDSVERYGRALKRFYSNPRHREIRDNALGRYIARGLVRYARHLPLYVLCVGVVIETIKGVKVDLVYVTLISKRRYSNWQSFVRDFRPLTDSINPMLENFQYCTTIVQKGLRVRCAIDREIRQYLSQKLDINRGSSRQYWVYYAIPRLIFYHYLEGTSLNEFVDSICEKCFEVLRLTYLYAKKEFGQVEIDADLYAEFGAKLRRLMR